MLGIKVRQVIPASAVSLEELVPHDHFYRHLEQVLDLTFVRRWVPERFLPLLLRLLHLARERRSRPLFAGGGPHHNPAFSIRRLGD